jgi:hypothetical protein
MMHHVVDFAPAIGGLLNLVAAVVNAFAFARKRRSMNDPRP